MLGVLVLVGWVFGSVLAASALLLGGVPFQMVMSVIFNLMGIGLILIGLLIVATMLVRRPYQFDQRKVAR